MSLLDSTIAQYRSLRLSATAGELATLLARAEANELSYLSFAQSLVEHELNARSSSRVSRNLKQAQFPSEKHLEAFDYRHQTTITKRQVSTLLDFSFIDNLRIPRSSGHPFHEHLTTDSTLIRPPIPRASGH
ncbi:ATP-binding protein [Pseudomonas putida]